MNYHIDLQHACHDSIPVPDELLIRWAELTLANDMESAELTLRLVDEEEITHLNHTYRKQNKPTNVLAFPSSLPEGITLDFPLLGDVIICPSVLHKESQELGKSLDEHWAHIVIHGVLHLLGYDHIKDNDAEIMQAIEIKILANLGFTNPYHIEGNHFE